MNKFLQILLLVILACSRNDRLETALKISGANRAELEKVLAHYSQNETDSLKLRAAEFLIENMPGHYAYSDRSIDLYTEQFDSINKEVPMYLRSYFYSFPTLNNPNTFFMNRNYDTEHITAAYLIKNIDYKFRLRDLTPWGKDIDFSDFCEYILPYRVDNEPLTNYDETELEEHLTKMSKLFESMKYCDITIYNTNEDIRKKLYTLPAIKLPAGLRHNIYDCGAVAHYTLEQHRLNGVPGMIDFVPHWANANGRHRWNNFVDVFDKNIPVNYINRSKIAKVYRNTYSKNPAPMEDKNFIPILFTPFIKDVTSEYIKTSDVVIPFEKCKKEGVKNVYLAVFNELEWQPTAWSFLQNGGKAKFKDLGRGIVYLPIYYKNSEEKIANYPFLLDNRGNIKEFKPDNENRIKIHLDRKFPIETYKLAWRENLLGAVIEAANNAEFKQCDTIAIIDQPSKNSDYKISIHSDKQYRYYRIAQNSNNGKMFIAELSFGGLDFAPFISATSATISPVGPMATYEGDLKSLLTDGDIVDFATINSGLGLDFGKPIALATIYLTLRNDGNYIYPNNTYELMYHDKDGWVSMGVKKSTDYFIEYENVPSGALYWLRNLTEGREERIFTYENGRMKFW